jgi:phage gpG-like protein
VFEYTWKPDRFDHFQRVERGLHTGIKKQLGVVARMLHREININLTGRVLHKRSGKLLRSWRGHQISKIPIGWRLMLGSDVVYARIHEIGGMAGRGRSVRIPARAYIWKAVERSKTRILREMQGALEQIVRRT